ncbi:MAG: hypothetical protein G01um101429_888 [Parcubacteria group bacterium Gr01-1014_29]|nr:MAG: hypothetical protein G01um101429_888 [Parcubacteria group bacterium Gr01-1014_29]
MLTYFFHPTAEKEIARLPLKEQGRIFVQMRALCQLTHPLQHRNVIKLEGGENEFRLRVGNYRVKFTLRNKSSILVTHVEHRQVGY